MYVGLKELKELRLLLNDWDIFCSSPLKILHESMVDNGVGRLPEFLGGGLKKCVVFV